MIKSNRWRLGVPGIEQHLLSIMSDRSFSPVRVVFLQVLLMCYKSPSYKYFAPSSTEFLRVEPVQ